MSRKMVDAVLEMSEYNRFSKGIFGWVGFHTEWLEFEHEVAAPEHQSGHFESSLRTQSTASQVFP